MSLSSTDSVLKRFTYDWLIRFAELHPIKVTDHKDLEKFYDEDGRVEARALKLYNPNHSKYATISQLFTTGIIQNCSLSTANKCNILIGSLITFTDTLPGMITRFKTNNVFFYGESVLINNETVISNITFDELKYLLKFCKFGYFNQNIQIYATLTEPILFSEIWPHLMRCRVLRLYINNVVYDENLAQILRENRVIPKVFTFNGVDISDNAVLEVVDYIVSLPVRPINYELNFRQQKPVSFGEAVYDKYVLLGYSKKFYKPADRPFQSMAVRESHGSLRCSFTWEFDF